KDLAPAPPLRHRRARPERPAATRARGAGEFARGRCQTARGRRRGGSQGGRRAGARRPGAAPELGTGRWTYVKTDYLCPRHRRLRRAAFVVPGTTHTSIKAALGRSASCLSWLATLAGDRRMPMAATRVAHRIADCLP